MKKDSASSLFHVFNYIFFGILAFLMLYPMWYVVMYSLSNPNKIVLSSLYLWPADLSLETYRYVLSQQTIYSGLLNSLFITVVGTAVNLIVISFTAYPLSRDNLFGRKTIFVYFAFTMLFGGGLVPTYLVVRQLGLIDSLWSLIIPSALSVYYLLIMMKFFRGIPASLFDSAKLDGASEFYLVFKIVLPLSGAALAAIGLFCAVGHWNGYFDALIFLNSMEKYPLALILYGMLKRTVNPAATGMKVIVTPVNVKMTSVVIALIPILLVYPFLQKYFMSGVMLGSVKG
jgi:putative aldouronate transport system permease protein